VAQAFSRFGRLVPLGVWWAVGSRDVPPNAH
jgi:hypothetical protein